MFDLYGGSRLEYVCMVSNVKSDDCKAFSVEADEDIHFVFALQIFLLN